MTIEEEFFKTFKISCKTKYYCPKCKNILEDWWYGNSEPEYRCPCCDYETDIYCEDFITLHKEEVYPPITDRMLLELIWYLSGQNNTTFQDLKNKILKECIEMSDCKELKQQVKSLFEKGAKDEQ